MALTARQWLERIHALSLPAKVKIINVCGGHERAVTHAGLRAVLPNTIELIPGPGCPVCICPEEDVYAAIQLASREQATMLAFGDMLRVPVNVPKGEIRSLEQAKAAGADIRPLAAPQEAVKLARQSPEKTFVFFVAGFETTIAPIAAMLAEGIPKNLFLLLAGRLTWPAVAMLLDSGKAGFDALIAPGHVATVMGANEWAFVVEKHHIPTAVAGFTPESLLAAIYSTLRQLSEKKCFLDNCYPELVKPDGNLSAKRFLNQVMTVVDANWRGIGVIPLSVFALQAASQQPDARLVFTDYTAEARKRAGEMPPGCACAQVVLGQIYPADCRLYGTACTPRQPVGPCMVSDEGACRIWWNGGVRDLSSNYKCI